MAYEPKKVIVVSDDGEYEITSFRCYSDLEVENAKLHLSLKYPGKRIIVLKQTEEFKKMDSVIENVEE